MNDELHYEFCRRFLAQFMPRGWSYFERDGVFGFMRDCDVVPTAESTEKMRNALDALEEYVGGSTITRGKCIVAKSTPMPKHIQAGIQKVIEEGKSK